MAKIRLATDVGGTFTDLVYYRVDEVSGKAGPIETEKAHTTPPDFEMGVLDVIDKGDIDLSQVSFLAHGTTVVINALTERKGVKTGLITTAGFRDVLEIARGNRPDFFNLKYQKPEPFVPRYLRREVKGRMTYKGEIIEPLDLSDLPAIIQDFKEDGVEAIAVCLLHSYSNPEHEKQVIDEIEKLWPEAATIASSAITREWREYERSNTAVLSAYVSPIARTYLGKLEEAVETKGMEGAFYVMQSNGGIDTLSAAKRVPITIVESGPASGVLGAAALGQMIGEDNIIALDIGGTTAKCSLIENGRVDVTSQYMIEKSPLSAGYPIMTPVVDIVEIGNGGGSIAWADEHGKMHVGPQSAGARPGPVAYGAGGTEPTTTDANLFLSRINPDYFVNGEVEADMVGLEKALSRLGDGMGLSARETANGIIRIANHNMQNALKLVSINRGHDPRDFAMIAFGGGGAMHATALASDLGMPKVIIPASSAVFSAWGMLMSDLRRDFVRTQPLPINADTVASINATFEDIEAEALASFAGENVERERISFEHYLDMRYDGQEHSVRMPVSSPRLDSKGMQDLIAEFHDAYEREYTYRLDANINMVASRIVAFAKIDRPELAEITKNSDLNAAVKGKREVDFDLEGIHVADIYDRDLLGAGASFSGPAIVEESGTTTVVFPGQAVDVDDYGNLHISIPQSGGGA